MTNPNAQLIVTIAQAENLKRKLENRYNSYIVRSHDLSQSERSDAQCTADQLNSQSEYLRGLVDALSLLNHEDVKLAERLARLMRKNRYDEAGEILRSLGLRY